MNRWLVTGAAGFLGVNLGMALRGTARTIGIGRKAPADSPFESFVNLDLRDQRELKSVLHQVRPDVIVHAAAISGHETACRDPEQTRLVNTVASATIAGAAQDIGSRLIYISTDAVFSGTRGHYSEMDQVEPFSLYGETKLEGELLTRALCEDSLVVRTNFFGWSDTGSKSILEFFANSMRAGNHVTGFPDFIVSSIYVQSLIELLCKVQDVGFSGVIHLSTRDSLSKYDFGLTVAEEFGLDQDLIRPLPASTGRMAVSRTRNLSLDVSLASHLLGDILPSQREGIRQAYLDERRLKSELRNFHSETNVDNNF